MWVELKPWVLDDGRFPEVRVGQQVRAALEFWPQDPQPVPVPVPDSTSSSLDGTITSLASEPPGLVAARYRVRGHPAIDGTRRGIAAAGLFLSTEDAGEAVGRTIDLVGTLGIAQSGSAGARQWIVNQIILTLVPTVPTGEPPRLPEQAEKEGRWLPGERRLMTPEQYIVEYGAEAAAARGFELPGSIPDYSRAEQRAVDHVQKFLPRLLATRQDYLLDLTLVGD